MTLDPGRHGRRSRAGFTIIERMLSVGIVGLLAALAIPTLMRFQLRAKLTEGRRNIAAIRASEETYCAEMGVSASAVPVLPVAVGTLQAPWVLAPSDPHGFNEIGFTPEGPLYFQLGVVTGHIGLALAIAARSDVDGNGLDSTGGCAKPIPGTGTGIVGPFGTCPATGVLDPDTRAPNRLHLVAPCTPDSGIRAY